MQTKQNKTIDKSPKNWFAIPVDIYSYLNPADEKLEMISFGRSTGWYILDTGGAIYVLYVYIDRNISSYLYSVDKNLWQIYGLIYVRHRRANICFVCYTDRHICMSYR